MPVLGLRFEKGLFLPPQVDMKRYVLSNSLLARHYLYSPGE